MDNSKLSVGFWDKDRMGNLGQSGKFFKLPDWDYAFNINF